MVCDDCCVLSALLSVPYDKGVHFATGHFFEIKTITEAGHRKVHSVDMFDFVECMPEVCRAAMLDGI